MLATRPELKSSDPETVMTERVQIILIVTITVAVLIILLVYRNRTKRFRFDAHKDGITTELETVDPAERAAAAPKPRGSVIIRGSQMIGEANEMNISRGNVEIEEFKQKGKRQKLNVTSDESSKKKP
jgi:hypothetical protein